MPSSIRMAATMKGQNILVALRPSNGNNNHSNTDKQAAKYHQPPQCSEPSNPPVYSPEASPGAGHQQTHDASSSPTHAHKHAAHTHTTRSPRCGRTLTLPRRPAIRLCRRRRRRRRPRCRARCCVAARTVGRRGHLPMWSPNCDKMDWQLIGHCICPTRGF